MIIYEDREEMFGSMINIADYQVGTHRSRRKESACSSKLIWLCFRRSQNETRGRQTGRKGKKKTVGRKSRGNMADGNRPSRTTTMEVWGEEIRKDRIWKAQERKRREKELGAEILLLRNYWVCKCPYWRKIRLSSWTSHTYFANH